MHALTATLLSFLLMTPAATFGPGYLGVFLQESEQAVVREVIPGTAAQKAGLKAGDVLLAVDGKKTPTRASFVQAIQSHDAGDRVRIQLRRGKRDRVVVVKLGERQEPQGAGADVVAEEPPKARRKPTPEVEVSVPTAEIVEIDGGKGYLGVSVREAEKGLAVDRVLEDGPCAKAGVESGDVIMNLGDHRVRTLDDLDGALGKVGAGRKTVLGVLRGDRVRQLRVTTGRRPGEAPQRASIERRVRRPIEVEAHESKKAREVVVEAHEPEVAEIEAAPAKPARPARPARPAKPSRAAKPRRPVGSPARRAPENSQDLRKELKQLRQELKELRKLLEELKRGGE